MGRLTIRRSPLGACHFDEVSEKIIWLRKHYHYGPAKIAMYLVRYND